MLSWPRSGLRHCLGGDIGETSDCAQAASRRFSLPPDQVTERRFAAAANAVEASDLGDRTTRGAHDVGKDMPWWPLLPGKNARNEIGGRICNDQRQFVMRGRLSASHRFGEHRRVLFFSCEEEEDWITERPTV